MDSHFDAHKSSSPSRSAASRANAVKRTLHGAAEGKETPANNPQGASFGITEIDISLLDPNPFQPRLSFNQDKLLELAASIKEQGLLQPIKISPKPDGRFITRFGHRRIEATKMIMGATIKAIIVDDNPTDAVLAAEALSENLKREEMHIIDTALAMKAWLEAGVFVSQEELAEKTSMDKTQVSKTLKILSLPETVLSDLIQNKTIKDRVVLDILRTIRDEKDCINIYKWYLETRPGREQLKQRIASLESGESPSSTFEIKNTSKGCTIKAPKLTTDQSKRLEAFLLDLFSGEKV